MNIGQLTSLIHCSNCGNSIEISPLQENIKCNVCETVHSLVMRSFTNTEAKTYSKRLDKLFMDTGINLFNDDRHELICLAIYKHFKGKYYSTMGISKPLNVTEIDFKQKLIKVRLTERDYSICVIINEDGSFNHNIEDDTQELVLYKSLYDDTIPYARPKDMFLAEVDKVKYPDIEQKYRFELVRY